MSPDKNVEAVRAKLLERSQIGLAKYGVTTERTDTDLVGWLNHLQEELMDAAVYVQRSMVDIEAQKAEIEAAQKDAERLDWILAHSDATVCSDGVYGPFHIWFRYSNRTTDEALTARAAIDSAIEQAKGGA